MTTKHSLPQPDDAAQKQALAWFLEIKDGADLPVKRWRSLMDWLREDPRHEMLLADYELWWDQLAALGDQPEFIDYAIDEPTSQTRNRHWASWTGYKIRYAFAVASVVISMFVAWYGSGWGEYRTAVGEQKKIVLLDHSVLKLNTNSAVKVRFWPWQRSIILLKGEAYFAVAHNRWQPFWVYAGAGKVRALGTHFGVRYDNDKVTVALVEGSLLVNSHPTVSNEEILQSQTLAAGQVIRYDNAGVQTNAETSDVSSATAWTRGRLSFTSTRLVDVVREINRYRVRKITIGDPAINNELVTAYIDVNHIDDLIAELPELLNVEVRYDPQSGFVLFPAKLKNPPAI